jgi:LmbE family N-acetylglucosaminyl deacetylase
MRRVLFVSPHLDDVVFSCAARIVREVAAGASVTVATVFSRVRRGSGMDQEYATRREEDAAALRLLGAKPHWLGLLDAPSRNGFYGSFRRIVLETAPGDADYVDIVRSKLARLVESVAPDAIYLPLAVGTHIDHRLVFAAGWTLRVTCPQYFYEDQPYASVCHAVDLRLREIAAAFAMGENAIIGTAINEGPGIYRRRRVNRTVGFLRSFRAAPYVRRYLPAGDEHDKCEAILRRKLLLASNPPVDWKSEAETARRSDRTLILAALHAYRSQAEPFLGSRRKFLMSCRRHARHLGVRSWRVERYWHSKNR